MPVADEKAFTQAIEKGKIYPIYCLYSEEPFLIDVGIKQVTQLALGDGLSDFNVDSFYAGDAEISQIQDAVEQLPMMAQYRLVIVREIQDFKEKEFEGLMPLIENPVPSSVLVLTGTKVDKRKKFFKKIGDHGLLVEFKKPFENQIPGWITFIAQHHGLTIDDEAAGLLHQIVGSQLLDIDNELKKISQFLGDRKLVNADDVKKIAAPTRIRSIFELTNAIGNNDCLAALKCLNNLLQYGQNEIGIIALIARHLRLMLQAQEGLDDGITGPRLAAKMGVSPYFLKDYISQSKNWARPQLRHALRLLGDTDRALKSSPLPAQFSLENFILKTCSPK